MGEELFHIPPKTPTPLNPNFVNSSRLIVETPPIPMINLLMPVTSNPLPSYASFEIELKTGLSRW